jgi:hypothetical protein
MDRHGGTARDPYDVGIKLAFLHAGGYDAAARRIADDTRALVNARDNRLCAQCGSAGKEIDHIDGVSADPSNLQLLCTDCHRAKTAERRRPASDQERSAVADLVERRVRPTVPLLLADDELRWHKVEPSLRSKYNRRVKLEAAEIGIETRGRKWSEVMEDHHGVMTPAATRITEDDDSTYEPDSYFARAMLRDA